MSKKKKNVKKTPTRKSYSKVAKYQLIRLAGTRCQYCEKDVGSEVTYHHIIPRYVGGDDSLQNCSLLCTECHRMVHHYHAYSPEYKQLMEVIRRNKQKFVEEKESNSS